MTFTFLKNAKRVGGLRAGSWVALCLTAGAIFAPISAVGQSAEELRLTIGKSVVIDYPEDIRQISTTDPAILDASPITTREILVNAKGLGTATMVVWSTNNQRMFYNITVDLNVESLRRILRDTFPNETIDVRTSGESISLNGVVSSKEVADRAAALASVAAKTVVNNLRLPPEPIGQQILLRVTFAELNRLKAQEYGINFTSSGAFNFLGSLSTGGITNPANLLGRFTNLDLGIELKALESRNILQVLAQPNLVTADGQEASFLVGGEIPIPVPQGGANASAITILYREFGVRLKFTPHVTANGTIKLALNQEVSTLDFSNASTLNNYIIPAFSTRRTETNVELAQGATFVVAGLLDNRETEIFSKLPIVSSIPIIGNLFKNKVEKKNSTELLMMVTPEITMALGANDSKPEVLFPNEFLKRLTPEEVRRGAK
ncbi:MAG: pilus assembly protein N-terminal domain-containing protein [Acidobacteriota bacterium]